MTAADQRLPRYVVSGGPRERGRSYGRQAAERIRLSVAYYKQVFAHHAGLDWQQAVERGRDYLPSIEAYLPEAVEEMRGIAEGSGLEFGEILALNARSEIMFASGKAVAVGPGECTSFTVAPDFTESGHTLIGQNWDWLSFSRETMLLLQVHREEGPNYLTLVEAGLLAKAGVNAAGVGICTNTLVSTLDRGEPGVPYHIVLRRLFDATSMDQAAKAIFWPKRSLSANYMLADASGLAFNAETQPGGGEAVRVETPDQGFLVHANHFADPEFAKVDLRVRQSPSSLFRAHMVRSHLARLGRKITLEAAMAALSDERNYPCGVSAQPDPGRHPMERYCTVASLVMDLDAGALYVADGAPARRPYQRLDFHALLNDERETLAAAG